MCVVCSVGYGTVGLVSAATSPLSIPVTPSEYSSLRETVSSITLPDMEQPEWLKQQRAAEVAAASAASVRSAMPARATARMTVTYDVATRGAVSADVGEFKRQINETLNDGRGWAQMGVQFQEVASGGKFSLVLSEASQVLTFSSGCSAEYSCRVGRFVIINQDRWLGATPSWNAAGGGLRDYRHMVVNHETGHWLGHGHRACGGSGQPAPVMQQQSMNLQGCSFNPWPLASELTSTQLGIR